MRKYFKYKWNSRTGKYRNHIDISKDVFNSKPDTAKERISKLSQNIHKGTWRNKRIKVDKRWCKKVYGGLYYFLQLLYRYPLDRIINPLM